MSIPDLLSPRSAIRLKVCSILRASIPLWDESVVSERIHDSRSIPLSPKKLPAVLVYSRDERLDEADGHADPGLRRRILELAVEVVALDDIRMDYLCSAVEAVMENNETLGNLVEGTRLKRMNVDRDSDGENTLVAARMDFEVIYWTRPLVLAPVEEDSIVRGAPPAYTREEDDPDGEDSPPVLGITPGDWEKEGDRPGSGDLPPEPLILYSTAPFIGPEYESHYEPATPHR